MAELNLQTEWIAEDVVKVSWTDTWNIGQSNAAGGAAYMVLIAIFGIGVFFTLNGASMLILFICVLACIALAIYFQHHSFSIANSLAVDPDGLHQDGHFFALEDISRVEYSQKSQWTGNQPQAGKNDPIQIRLWLRDNTNHVLSENNWETQVNHRIRDAIEAAILGVRRMENEDRREQREGPANQFGMPDY
ncbi:hypothetical protein LVO79_20995 (plasmid) [Roseivivax marinus]|uniref:hypothetical protein n=1 Tax=Roseivivax marinus TaxID=1379903 RepID=UPI001F0395D8|nr:hypothetical protein [Roseivivax marinus]UMA67260.1 hypothetical protein LVO79_20995 [Roseivivax marinus]